MVHELCDPCRRLHDLRIKCTTILLLTLPRQNRHKPLHFKILRESERRRSRHFPITSMTLLHAFCVQQACNRTCPWPTFTSFSGCGSTFNEPPRVAHDILKDAIANPGLKPSVNGALRTIFGRKIFPFGPVVEEPEAPTHNGSFVGRRPSAQRITGSIRDLFHKPIELFVCGVWHIHMTEVSPNRFRGGF